MNASVLPTEACHVDVEIRLALHVLPLVHINSKAFLGWQQRTRRSSGLSAVTMFYNFFLPVVLAKAGHPEI